jgi:hypothetical protein
MTQRVLRCTAVVVLMSVVAGAGALAAGDLATLRSLWGTEITAEEFLRVMSPSFLSALPARSREAAKTTQVQWGGTSAVLHSTRSAVPTLDSATPGSQEPSLAGLFDIYVNCTNRFSFSGTTASFGASNTVLDPPFMLMPFMCVYSQLMFGGALHDLRTSAKTNVWRVTASGSHPGCGAGYYYNLGYHWVEFPAGYSPPTGFVITESLLWEVVE